MRKMSVRPFFTNGMISFEYFFAQHPYAITDTCFQMHRHTVTLNLKKNESTEVCEWLCKSSNFKKIATMIYTSLRQMTKEKMHLLCRILLNLEVLTTERTKLTVNNRLLRNNCTQWKKSISTHLRPVLCPFLIICFSLKKCCYHGRWST